MSDDFLHIKRPVVLGAQPQLEKPNETAEIQNEYPEPEPARPWWLRSLRWLRWLRSLLSLRWLLSLRPVRLALLALGAVAFVAIAALVLVNASLLSGGSGPSISRAPADRATTTANHPSSTSGPSTSTVPKATATAATSLPSRAPTQTASRIPTTPPPTAAEWQPDTPYAAGAKVRFGATVYVCLQAHTSQIGWEPPATPALWQD